MDQSITGLRCISVKARRARDRIKWCPFHTHVIRRDIVRDLGEPYDTAVAFVKDWGEDFNVWLPTSLITLAQDSSLDYLQESDTYNPEENT